MTKLTFFFTALSFIACKSLETKPVKIPAHFDWQGHRGCRGLKPENSLPAFLHALKFPEVVTLELDLAVSKDGQLIVSHEPFFNPAICLKPDGSHFTDSTALQLPLNSLTALEIQSYDCGSLGNLRFLQQEKMKVYKPSLREVIQTVRAQNPNVRWNMEIKSQPEWDGRFHPVVDEFASLVISEIRMQGLEKLVTVQSFDTRALEAMHRLAPEIPLAYLIENQDDVEKNMKRLSFTPLIYSPYYLTVNKKMRRVCNQHHMKLIPWTVNDVASMRRLIRLGVDGIITDYPNLIGKVGR
ncbi:MAG: glycerophosphodiester phosphodiesterase [Saprospiraceae bacterium]|nr:glycerophosphodiester phosphodiesterase [Saprospiraceae bacterium]